LSAVCFVLVFKPIYSAAQMPRDWHFFEIKSKSRHCFSIKITLHLRVNNILSLMLNTTVVGVFLSIFFILLFWFCWMYLFFVVCKSQTATALQYHTSSYLREYTVRSGPFALPPLFFGRKKGHRPEDEAPECERGLVCK
jgi:hypothetical protein